MAEETIENPIEEEEEEAETPEEAGEKPEEEEEPEEEAGRKIGALTSPEGVIMLLVAGFLDLIGIILICFGVDDFGILDIFGIIIIGGWMLLRGGTATAPEKAKAQVAKGFKKIFRGKWQKFLIPIVGEVVPYSGAFIWWTFAVYYELTS